MPDQVPVKVLRRSLGQVRHGICIADACQPDMPLVYVNDAFLAMTGYHRDELIGFNCRVLQANDDQQRALKTIRSALAARQPCRVTLRNYRKDGTLFWNDLSLTPVFTERGELTHYIGVQQDITAARETKSRLQKYQRQLRALAHQLIHTEEAERQRMAREMHDQVGQTLSLCRMQLGQLVHDLGGATAHPTLASACKLVESAIQETRALMHKLSPPLLDELGLPAALRWLGEQLAQRYGMAVEIDAALPRSPAIPDDLARMVYRSARELMINACKHADAQSVQVRLSLKARQLVLEVTDDGRGLPAQPKTDPKNGGFGLFSIRERAEHVGGTLVLRRGSGQGTCAVLRLPLPPAGTKT